MRAQLGLDRIHLLGTSWGGMLALEHVLSGAEGIVGLILSSTLASVDQWAAEQTECFATRFRRMSWRSSTATIAPARTTIRSTSRRWRPTSIAISIAAPSRARSSSG